MRKIYKFSLLFALLASGLISKAQNQYFSDAGQNKLFQTDGNRVLQPNQFRSSSLNEQALKNFLWNLPSEENFIANRANAPIISLPMPDGSVARFRIWESSIQAPALAARFSTIKTFAGQGIDDPYATIRCDYNPYFGFSAQILSAKTGRIYIDPYAKWDTKKYISYFQKDAVRRRNFNCLTPDEAVTSDRSSFTEAGPCLGTQLRTYRLAVACTGEYSNAVAAGNAAATHAAIVTSTNRITGVYEVELAIRLLLVANNNLIEYTNGATDPFVNTINTTLLNANQTNTDAVIGAANYDIGHVFTSDDNGLAQLNAVCGTGKARGATGSPVLVGDGFDIDYVAHEIGHQFGASHTFNGASCFGGAAAGGSYEPGGGTTIMAYAGICGANDNIQPNSDPIFHAISFDQIGTFISTGGGSSCASLTSTGNTLPIINTSSVTPNNLSIPINTPFTLNADANDANGDAITYNWEGWDIGPADTWTNAGATTNRPLFRTRVSKTTGERTFPDIRVIAANYPLTAAPSAMNGLRGEVLPTVARAMKFRLTVRDNRAGGGGVVSYGEGCQSAATFQVNAVGTTPFTVTSPNGGESFAGGSTQTITWNNAGTTAAPFNVANVRITLSTDGGLTYPTVITNSTANDGSEALTIPPVTATTTARIKIEAIGNIFFDISNTNFSITAPVNGFTFNSPFGVAANCPAPNDMTSGNLTASFTGSFTGDVALSATVSPTGPTVVFSNATLNSASPSSTVTLTGMSTQPAGTYLVTVTGTPSTTGIATQTRVINFTINASGGPSITGQPANIGVCAGSTASFSVTATGTYQWQLNTGAGFNNITGATNSTYTTGASTAGMNGYQYRCIVTGQCGNTTSNAATLTVNTAPTVTTNPTSASICSSNTISFTAAGGGSPAPGFQWQVNTGSGFSNISGANSATYTTPATTIGMSGYQYQCVLSNTCGTVTTAAATLTVSSSVTITNNPLAQTICEGTNTSFSVSAGGSGLTYQWQLSTDGTNYNNVPATAPYSGVTASTLTITGAAPSLNGNRYRCIVSSGPCTPGISTGALLTVNTFPSIGTQPIAATICEGANATFSVAASTGVGSLTYQWQLSTNGGVSWSNIAGATTNSFAQTAISATQNGYQFRVLVTAGCGTTPSSAAVLTVNTFPVVAFGSIPFNICKSDAAFALSATPIGGAWSGAGVTGANFSPVSAGVGVRTVTYTVTNAGCTTTQPRIINVLECPERQRRLPDYQAVFVYPNPNNGQFNIRLNSDLYTRLGARVFGTDGRLYLSQVFTGVGYGSIIPIDISKLAAGTYQVFLYNDEGGLDKKAVSIIVYR
ncbi:MAG: hypothetical protein RL115_1213 [Bacteroidota bacterium]|jgi:hypothetical protein